MRYKKILVDGQFLVNICTQDLSIHALCVNGLPEDTKFAYAIPDTTYGIWIVVEHYSFPELKSGDIIPEHERPVFHKIS